MLGVRSRVELASHMAVSSAAPSTCSQSIYSYSLERDPLKTLS
jgi:hypothetical protein